MKHLIILSDSSDISSIAWQERSAARAIILGSDGLMPLLFVSKYGYHKLPGGGVDAGESIEEALYRECIEEVGAVVNILSEVGMSEEYRSVSALHQISYCYLAELISRVPQAFTESETEEGFELVWMTLSNAISTLESEAPNDYEGGFIVRRDLALLKETKNLL